MKTLLAVECCTIVLQKIENLRNKEINFVRNETNDYFFVYIPVLGM